MQPENLRLKYLTNKRFWTHASTRAKVLKKPTETFQYTHYSSCHPARVSRGFIKGIALRLLRRNSSKTTFEENIRKQGSDSTSRQWWWGRESWSFTWRKIILKKKKTENGQSRAHATRGYGYNDNEQKRILSELGAKIESSANSGQKRASGKRKRKIPVPQQCRVSIFLSWFVVDHDRLVCYMCSHTNAKHKLPLCYKQLVLLSVHLPLWLQLIDEPSSPWNLWLYSFVIVREALRICNILFLRL